MRRYDGRQKLWICGCGDSREYFADERIWQDNLQGVYCLCKVKRYGKWYFLKGLQPTNRDLTQFREYLKKEFELEIRGTEEDPKGFSLEIFNFNKSKYVEYFDSSEEYMKKSLMIFSLDIKIREGKNEEEVKKLCEELYNTLNKKLPDQFELHFRHKGQKLNIEFILIKGEFIKPLFDLGVDLNKFSDFNLIFKTKLDFHKIFDNNLKENEKVIDLLSLLFSIKSSGENIKYLIRAFYEALKDVKLSDYKLQVKYNKIIRFLNFVNSFITSKIKFHFKFFNIFIF